jgi:methylated-DNA-[protein]-cysteine S-methyltransferase
MKNAKTKAFEKEAPSLRGMAFETDLGWMVLIRRGEKVARFQFGYPSESAARKAIRAELGDRHEQLEWVAPDTREKSWVRDLTRYAAGHNAQLDEIPVDESKMTEFQRKVRQACRKLKRGETATYGELARKVGRPGAARAVGTVMSRNPTPLIIPCHRVVGVTGLGGFSAPQGLSMKEFLLRLERGESCCGCDEC